VAVRPTDDHRDASGGGPDDARRQAAQVIAEAVRDAGPREIPQRLCSAVVALLPVTEASASLHGAGLPVPVGSSGTRAVELTELQATLGDAPCLSAVATGTPVLASDLTRGPDQDRWPVFAHEATAAGARAAYSIPLGNGTVCVGTLDLYRDTPGELTPGELHTAELVAGVMTVALMALPHEERGALDSDRWLDGLGADHDEIYQATGMIMAQLGVGPDEALARLRAHAFAQGRTVLEVAGEVVGHRVRFDRE
jgi:hypothetical protein